MKGLRYLKILCCVVVLVLVGGDQAGAQFAQGQGPGTAAQAPSVLATTPEDAAWVEGFHLPGVDGEVYAAVTDSSGTLYVGGDFNIAGDVDASCVARWDGSRWHSLAGGVEGSGWVRALAVAQNGTLYASGVFTSVGGVTANNVAMWNGTQWSPLGSGIDSNIRALAVDGSGTLYAGGGFTSAGGVPASYIAKWNGSSWSGVGGGVNDSVLTLHAVGNTVYAGGHFTTAGGIDAPGVARWDGSSWSAVIPGLQGEGGFPGYEPPGYVTALDVDGTAIVVAGSFTFPYQTPGETYTETYGSLVRWDGSRWRQFPGNLTNSAEIHALEIAETGIYVGGGFRAQYSPDVYGLMQWKADDSWTGLGDNSFGDVYALVSGAGGKLYAGGTFESAGETTVVDLRGVGAWDGSAWQGLGGGKGVLGWVGDLALVKGQLYAAGNFRVPDKTPAGVARWHNGAWETLGNGLDHAANAIVGDAAGNLYVGLGDITGEGSHLLWWNGSLWQALGGGVNDEVNVLAFDSQGNLYAAGLFTQAGGVPANHIAKWDGTSWSPLGEGLSWEVSALVIDAEDNVYVGGKFTLAGGEGAKRVAKWDGSSWSPLGSGFSGQQNRVFALALGPQGDLYASGWLLLADSWEEGYLARWDGSQWAIVVDDSVPVSIYEMLFDSRGRLYVGGRFTSIGGVSANNIARWDGSSWSALGSGITYVSLPTVSTLAFDAEENLWVGGTFDHAGDKVSQHIAQHLFRNIATLEKGASTALGAPGQEIEYTLEVFWDAEDGRAATAWVEDPIPAATTYIPDSATASSGDNPRLVGNIIRWDGTLNDGQKVTLRYRVRLDDCATMVASPTWPTVSGTATGEVGGLAVSAPHTLDVGQPDLAITGVEVTQGIQNLNNEVTLAHGKETLVRAYVQVIPPAGGPACDIPGIGATLTGSTDPVAPVNPGFTARSEPRTHRPSAEERNTRANSLNFAPPRDWLSAPGSHLVSVTLQPPAGYTDPNPANDTHEVWVTTEAQPPLDLLLYKVRWQRYSFGQWHEGRAIAGGKIYMKLAAMFPFEGVNARFLTYTFDPTTLSYRPPYLSIKYPQPWTAVYFRIGYALELQRLWNRAFGSANAGTIAYGYVGAADEEYRPDGGLTYIVGSTAAGGTAVQDGVYVATHEAGHIFGIQHVDGKPDRACDEPLVTLGWPSGWRPFVETAYPHDRGKISSTADPHALTTFYGYDATARNGIRRPGDYDIMTYCGNRWISNYTWDKVRAWGAERTTQAATLQTSEEMLLVSGIISATAGEPLVELESLYRLSGAPAQPLPDPGDYNLNIRQGETLLASYPFTVTAAALITYTDPGFTFFDMIVPYPDGATEIEVAYGAEAVASRAVSANPPTVTLTLPASATPLTGTLPLTITASDPDGDDLTFTLLSSSDDGATWQSLTANFTETVYALHTRDLAGGEQRLRLFASDGVNTADVVTLPFEVAHKPPQVVIGSLEEGAQYPVGENLLLQGVAWDESGSLLAGDALRWTDSISGTLGTGETLYVAGLAPGWHTLTLRGEDGNGRTAEAQVRIFIGSRIFLPVVLRW